MVSTRDEGTYDGGCHCGEVRFRIRVRSKRALACNCSMCAKKGVVNLIVSAADFTLLQGEELLSTYQFNTGTARHRFCTRCGIHSFSRPRSHPDDYDVNVRCLDGSALRDFEVSPFDGRNWENAVRSLQ